MDKFRRLAPLKKGKKKKTESSQLIWGQLKEKMAMQMRAERRGRRSSGSDGNPDYGETQCLPMWDKGSADTVAHCPVPLLSKVGWRENGRGQGLQRDRLLSEALFPKRPSDICGTGNFCALFTFLPNWLERITEPISVRKGVDEEVGQDASETRRPRVRTRFSEGR